MACVRFLTGVAVLLSACASGSATPERDMPDASLAEATVPDAVSRSPDAASTRDASLSDATTQVTCSVANQGGICIDTATCAAMPGHISTPGFCPGSANIQCCTLPAETATCDPDTVPEPNVGLVEEPGEGGCPAGMLRISDTFCIDRFEAALDVVPVGDAGTAPWSPYFNPGASRVAIRVIARSLRGAVPQGYVTGIQAAAACAEAGKRLCTDNEWLRACRGPDDLTYPYGETRETGVCNDHRAEHPAVELFGSVTMLTSPCINELHDTVDRTGARTGCVTAEGAYDMMGNLHEWTADANGSFRGGFYVDTIENGPGCLYVTTAHTRSYDDYSTGFRCCAD